MRINAETAHKLSDYIIEGAKASTSADFDALGRALLGVRMIQINKDGSICNTYAITKRKYCNADWRAIELIDDAIKNNF